MLNGRKEEADDGLDVKEEHQLDALQPVSFVANSNISSSSSSRFDSSHTSMQQSRAVVSADGSMLTGCDVADKKKSRSCVWLPPVEDPAPPSPPPAVRRRPVGCLHRETTRAISASECRPVGWSERGTRSVSFPTNKLEASPHGRNRANTHLQTTAKTRSH